MSVRALLLLVVMAFLAAIVVFTDTGRSARVRAERALGMGAADAIVDFGRIDPEMVEAAVPAQYLSVSWLCGKTRYLGDRSCDAQVASINGVPARQLGFYFERMHLTAVRAGYAADQFDELAASLDKLYPRDRSHSRSATGRVAWRAGRGILLSEPEPTANGEIVLLWQPAH